jgi:pyruvate-formate lyase-activating enzyme
LVWETGCRKMRFLPYHTLGANKYRMLQREDEAEHLEAMKLPEGRAAELEVHVMSLELEGLELVD